MAVTKMTFKQLTEEFGLQDNTLDFLGHAVALYTDNSYTNRPAVEVLRKVQLYTDSIGRFGDSPFIYPVYGLSGIPESFSRKSAVYGGTYMLNVDLKKIESEGDRHKITGVWEGEESFCYAKKIIAHPAYLEKLGMMDRIKKTSVTVRVICILDHPIEGTGKNNAVQIILPQNQIKRNSDIYIMMIGKKHGVCKEGFNLAIISTTKESDNIEEDLKVAFDIIGEIKYKFVMEETMYAGNDPKDNIFVTSTLDATSHFESSAEDVIAIYKAMTGKELDLKIEEKSE